MEHKELVNIAYKWCLNVARCGCAFRELSSISSETPDVIGFYSWGISVLIEVKVTRSDFLQDKKKIFRRFPEQGMGTQRFYCCPSGMIKTEELPEGWGLIYVNEKKRATCIHNPYKSNMDRHSRGLQKNIIAEHSLMYSALRRLHIRGLVEEIYKQK